MASPEGELVCLYSHNLDGYLHSTSHKQNVFRLREAFMGHTACKVVLSRLMVTQISSSRVQAEGSVRVPLFKAQQSYVMPLSSQVWRGYSFQCTQEHRAH